jgi:hypothetical protein
MKKLTSLLFLVAALATVVAAQSLKKTERINADQVPVAIRKAFETDFGKIPDDGYWTAIVVVERDGARSVAKPLSYTYHNKASKTEVRYMPDGKLDFVKGLEKVKHDDSPAS